MIIEYAINALKNQIKHISEFEGDLKSCRQCLENRRKKVNCACGARYSAGSKTSHVKTQMHQFYLLDNY